MEKFFSVITDFFSNYGFFFVFSLCCVIFLFCSAFVKNKILKLAYVVSFSVFFSLAAAELLLSFSINLNEKTALDTLEYSKNIVDANNAYLVSDEEKAKLQIPYTDIKWDPRDRFYKNGFRYTRGNQNSKRGYVFLGCSFTYGDAVNHDETLPYYFSKLMNFDNKVLNCGVCSRGSDTALNILNSDIIEKIMDGAKIERFFYVLIAEHVNRNFRLFSPYSHDIWILKKEGWTLAQCPFLKIKLFFAKSRIFRRIFLSVIDGLNKKFYDDYLLDSVSEMRKIVKEKYGSELTVIVFPGYDTKVEGDVLLVPRRLDRYKAVDGGHPGPRAYEEIANLLYEHITSRAS